ncbi:MAG: amino acid adenylation domain-containing protein, partial [Synechococcales cyanobacterium RM1_1_8]|nr:amino acid adenylation domain-containing protein [Synechococcales cyanobacterium RM1_1_8]
MARNFVNGEEYKRLVSDRNQTARDWNVEICVSQLFEAQVAATPAAIALVYGDQALTYDQLNRRVNQLAHHLCSQGIQPEDLVGLCLDRSFEMVIGMLAIHKAGAAYLPLDPNYPADRLSLIVEDAQPKFLLTQAKNADCLPELDLPHIWMDRDAQMLAQLPDHNPEPRATGSNLAYLIYTSGSTGKPKGVMIEHRSLSNFCQAVQEFYAVGQGDRVLQFSTINFDLSVEQFYPYLICGGSLALRTPEMTESIPQFLACCAAWEVTVLDLPTAYWNLLVVEMISGGYALPPSIRRAVIIGEPASPERVAQWQQLSAGRAPLVNSYGPTEATVAATRYFVPPQPTELDAASAQVSIGVPMGNMQIYLLDAQQQLVPDGSIGEICIGGLGVARGYLNRPEINADRFICDRFSGTPNGRLYRTGDLGRYRADGNLICLGRMDNQVKLRGYRIELGEIETCLNQHPMVKQAVVIVREDTPGNKRLVAYWVNKQGQQATATELSSWVAGQLPDYMVPSALVSLEALPLNANGKVDRKALPLPAMTMLGDGTARALTASEQQLAEIWAALMGLAPSDLQGESNYFELGGNSLSALGLLVQVEKEFGVRLNLSDLFLAPTLGAMALRLEEQRQSGASGAAAETTLMQLRPSGQKSPFFFINSISFGLLLAPHFAPDHPFYSINIFGATERLLALESGSLRAIAESCTNDLQTVQPHGPYHLGGYCDDSKLAFEMAQCLQERGEEVALLAFIDANWEAEVNDLHSHWANLRNFGLSYLGEKVRSKVEMVQHQLGVTWQSWISHFRQAQGEEATEVGRDILLLRRYNAATAAHQPQIFA